MQKRAMILACTILFLAAGGAIAAGRTPPHRYDRVARLPLELDGGRLYVRVSEEAPAGALRKAIPFEGATLTEPLAGRWRFVEFAAPMSGRTEAEEKIAALLGTGRVDFASPVFFGTRFGILAPTPDILVRFEKGDRAFGRSILASYDPGGTIVQERFGGMDGAYKIRPATKNGFAVLALANRLAEDPRVRWAEPDFLMTGRGDLVPDDPGFPDLWGIRNTGQFGGTPDMDMDGDDAWDLTTGDSTIKILIIDTGVQQDHPDLHQAPGRDFTTGTPGGGPGNACDNHGTAVAGCVSAIINNTLGTVGIAPGCRIVSARVGVSNVPCDGTWLGQYSWSVDALDWALGQGVRVTNNSNSYGSSPNALIDKYAETRDSGMVHFASAGNDGVDGLGFPSSLPTVMAIMALTPNGTRASFSNWNSELAFGAPGTSVYTTDRTGTSGYSAGDYSFVQGTSFSSPYSAGVAALLLSKNPALSAPDVEEILDYTCVDLGSAGFDDIFGWGFVNADAALRFGGWFDATAPPLDDAGTGGGVAWGDYDSDGDPDLYIANDGANVLLQNNGIYGFLDVTAAPLDDAGTGGGVAWGDYDNDGDLDLYLANDGPNKLFENLGGGLFGDATSGPLGDAGTGRSVSWADVESDGDLDLYVANNGANKLFRNDGGTFADATIAPLGDVGDGYGAAWGDYDNDGDPDLYLANDGFNRLLRNDGGGLFSDVTAAPLGDAGAGAGAAWGDHDNDGDLDLYVTNNGGNKLFDNQGGGVFSDATAGPLADGGDGRGVGWADADNDGDLDLYVVNHGSGNVFLRNDGGGVFSDATPAPLGDTGNGKGMAWGDYDGDGLPDIYLVNEGSNRLVRNVSAPTHSWIHLDLAGVVSNRSSVGARARVVAGGLSSIREIGAGSGYLSMNSLTAEFGLGGASAADTVHVVWPSGLTKTFTALAADSVYTILELAPPVVAVVSPNGGEALGQGTVHTITWTNTGGDAASFFIEYSTDAGAVWDSVHYAALPGAGSYDWIVPMTPTAQGLVRITMQNGDGTDIDTSDGLFSILAVPIVTVTSPNGAESWEIGANDTITWTNTGNPATAYSIEYSPDSGSTWNPLADSLAGDGGGTFPWVVADDPTASAFVRVTLYNAEGSATDRSDGTFTILPPANPSTAIHDATAPPLGDTGNGRGIAWGDWDGDGDLDLYLANSDGANKLFRNDGGGAFADATSGLLGDVVSSYGVACADYDNDGDLDLYLANSNSPNRLFRNDAGTLVDVAADPVNNGGNGKTVAWGDYDNDGNVDLYLVNSGASNKLFRNVGDGSFTDATAGPVGASGTKLGAAWSDYDGDGDLDLYVVRLGTNLLLRNDGGGSFADVTSGPEGDGGSGYGAAWGDYDNDGDPDLYVVNHGANLLFRNDGGTFADATVAPLGDVGDGYGAAWGDYDNDGDPDLYLANDGFNRLFRNDGGGAFSDGASADLLDAGSGQGVAWGDYDADGDIDLYLSNLEGNKLFRNDLASGAHWIHVRLVGTVSNRSAIGAKVRLIAGGLSQTREVSGGGGYLSEGALWAEFGLASSVVVDTIEVTWPSGTVQVLTTLAADQFLEIVEPQALWAAIDSGVLGDAGSGQGVAWGDYDGDGDEDLYVTNLGGANVLMRNDGGDLFSDATAGPLGDGSDGTGMSWADYDNDGDLDLYLVNAGAANKLFRNDGGGGFADATTALLGDIGFGFAAVWGEIEGDGDVDLYVVNAGTSNRLYRNDGGGTFSDATTTIVGDAAGFGLTAAWGDCDGDGDGDLYLGNAFGANRLFRNDGGGLFADVASGPLADGSSTYGVDWGDYDNDGDLDLYLGNEGTANRLLRNDGGVFADATMAPLDDAGASYGVSWVDYDNDGDLDLFVVQYGANRLFENLGGGLFADAAENALREAPSGAGAAWADPDGDGDLDLYLVNSGGANTLFRNDNPPGAHWSHVSLVGSASNRSAIGARVSLFAGGAAQIRELSGGSGHLSQNSLAVEFGLGTLSSIDSIRVRWPSGTVTDTTAPPADRLLVLYEEGPATGVGTGPPRPKRYALFPNAPNPFNPATAVRFALPERSRVRLSVYDVSGRLVRVLADGVKEAGYLSVVWDGADRTGRAAGSGIYFVRMEAAHFVATRKMALLR